MELLVPGGGSWFDWLEQRSPSGLPQGHAGVDEPTSADVHEALDAMQAGHLEYVILDAGDGTFVQAAGSGGGYQLECWAGGAAVTSWPSASLEDVRAQFTAYLEGERTRPAGLASGAGSEKRPRRWFGRG